jgi:hypothetical protein
MLGAQGGVIGWSDIHVRCDDVFFLAVIRYQCYYLRVCSMGMLWWCAMCVG